MKVNKPESKIIYFLISNREKIIEMTISTRKSLFFPTFSPFSLLETMLLCGSFEISKTYKSFGWILFPRFPDFLPSRRHFDISPGKSPAPMLWKVCLAFTDDSEVKMMLHTNRRAHNSTTAEDGIGDKTFTKVLCLKWNLHFVLTRQRCRKPTALLCERVC